MKKICKKVFSVLMVIMLFLCTACSTPERVKSGYRLQEYQFAFEAFDTECAVNLWTSMTEEENAEVKAVIITYAAYLQTLFSRTDETSELYAINHRTEDSIMISDDVATLFGIGTGLYDWSDGLFDISAGTLVDLWDIKNRKELPTEEEIKEAKSHCANFAYEIEKDVEPDAERPHKITFYGDKKTKYDFGALVKGYCCDNIKMLLEDFPKVEAGIINLGGNVLTFGKVNDRKDGAFNVGIAKPFDPTNIIDVVKVRDRCVITSGNYQRYFKVEGDNRVYHHIIDPKTGYPTNNELNSVTIVSKNGLLGDYLSTACMLLGKEKSRALMQFCGEKMGDRDVQAIFVDKNNNVTKYPIKVNTY